MQCSTVLCEQLLLAAQACEEYDGMVEDCPEDDDELDSNIEEPQASKRPCAKQHSLAHMHIETVCACNAACTAAFADIYILRLQRPVQVIDCMGNWSYEAL